MNQQRLFSKGRRLYKRQKLCSQKAIDRLFMAARAPKNAGTGFASFIVYPLRAVCIASNRTGGADLQFFISIPKKRLRHAVDRVTMRRRVREAFRLENSENFTRPPVDVAFIYVADSLVDSKRIRRSMHRLLEHIYTIQTSPTADGI